jgi:hypothetical protein
MVPAAHSGGVVGSFIADAGWVVAVIMLAFYWRLAYKIKTASPRKKS